VFGQPSDPNREIRRTVMAFDVPKAATEYQFEVMSLCELFGIQICRYLA
jgi:hypothetical protein